MNARERMGRAVAGAVGLSGQAAAQERQSATLLLISRIRPGEAQPRHFFSPERAAALEASVRKSGILQPLLVRPVDGSYELVDGERRWRAAQAVGLSEVPVYIQSMTREQARLAAMTTALAREELTLIDEVEGKLGLAALELELSLEETRTELGRLVRPTADPRRAALVNDLFHAIGAENLSSFVRNKLPVLNWPEAIKEAMRGGLELTKAKTIRNAPEETQADLLERALAGATRAELAELVKAAKPTAPRSQADQVARTLSNQKWRDSLSPEQAEALATWLADAPGFVVA